MATITPAANQTGVTPQAASAGGDTLAIGSAQRATLEVVNGSGSSINVTLTAAATCNLGFTHNVVVPCPANQTTPIRISVNDPATAACINNGSVAVGYSATTSVTVFATTS